MDTDSLTNELLEVRNKNRNRNKETIIIIKTLCQIGKKVVIKIVNVLKSKSVEFLKVFINFQLEILVNFTKWNNEEPSTQCAMLYASKRIYKIFQHFEFSSKQI